jgi:hypothetical protein
MTPQIRYEKSYYARNFPRTLRHGGAYGGGSLVEVGTDADFRPDQGSGGLWGCQQFNGVGVIQERLPRDRCPKDRLRLRWNSPTPCPLRHGHRFPPGFLGCVLRLHACEFTAVDPNLEPLCRHLSRFRVQTQTKSCRCGGRHRSQRNSQGDGIPESPKILSPVCAGQGDRQHGIVRHARPADLGVTDRMASWGGIPLLPKGSQLRPTAAASVCGTPALIRAGTVALSGLARREIAGSR